MLAASSRPPPIGLTVGHTVVRFGMPPTESSPAMRQLALASRSTGRMLPPLLGGNASQGAAAPPAEQVHVQGPLPVTTEGVPMLQRLVAGAASVVVPLAGPH